MFTHSLFFLKSFQITFAWIHIGRNHGYRGLAMVAFTTVSTFPQDPRLLNCGLWNTCSCQRKSKPFGSGLSRAIVNLQFWYIIDNISQSSYSSLLVITPLICKMIPLCNTLWWQNVLMSNIISYSQGQRYYHYSEMKGERSTEPLMRKLVLSHPQKSMLSNQE